MINLLRAHIIHLGKAKEIEIMIAFQKRDCSTWGFFDDSLSCVTLFPQTPLLSRGKYVISFVSELWSRLIQEIHRKCFHFM